MTTTAAPRTAHPYLMHDAILEQPEAIGRILAEEGQSVDALARIATGSARIHIVGIGASWHAALVGEYLLRTIGTREDTRAWNSFEFCTTPPRLGGQDTVIVLSHRGTKTYSAQSLELARHHGAKTAIVTAIGSAADAGLADVVVRTCKPETSSAFTVSHTSAMTVLAMLAARLGGSSADQAASSFSTELERLPDLVAGALSQESAVREWAGGSKGVERFYFAGWGPNASTAYETALMMKESSYTTTEGFQLEQYLHGPFVSTDEGCQVTFIAPPIAGADRVLDLIGAVKAVGAGTVAIVQQDDGARSGLVDTVIEVPPTSELLSPLVYLVPLQLFTYWLAVELGRNPDVFRLNDPKHVAARESYRL